MIWYVSFLSNDLWYYQHFGNWLKNHGLFCDVIMMILCQNGVHKSNIDGLVQDCSNPIANAL